jgi:hypothetical protein
LDKLCGELQQHKASEWISVDTLPEDIHNESPQGGSYTKYWVTDGVNQWSAELYYISHASASPITHWMPLPKAPTC